MIVKSLRLNNFRNYSAQEIKFPPGLIALTGDNGQGKTNLLEAVCVLATTKSPLVERDRELIRWHERGAKLSAEVEIGRAKPDGSPDVRKLEYAWRVEGNGNTLARELKAGGVPQSAVAAWLGQLQVVAFFPHDLALLTGEPDGRRKFLNLELGKTRPAYFADVARYRKTVQQRNALLKHYLDVKWRGARPEDEMGTLGSWNKQLISYGSRILAERARFFDEIAPILSDVYAKLSGLETPFSIEYLPGLSALKKDEESWDGERFSALFERSLKIDERDDRRRGTTASGPHRDEMVFRLGEMNLRKYGSQGQQRLGVLSLKVALARWVKETTQEAPILLLDDALSELDATRRGLLLDEAREFPQSIVTATDATFIENAAAIFRVENGRVVDNSAPLIANDSTASEIISDLSSKLSIDLSIGVDKSDVGEK